MTPPFLHNPICYIGYKNSTIISSGLGARILRDFIMINGETTRTQKHFVKDQESNRMDARSSNNCRTVCHCSDFSQAPVLSCLNPPEKNRYSYREVLTKNNCFCVGATCLRTLNGTLEQEWILTMVSCKSGKLYHNIRVHRV